MNPATRRRCAPLFRRAFAVEGRVTAARLQICGLGFYEAHINGRRIGDHVLDPAQTDYEQRCLYVTYDVGDHLRPGANLIGVMLGDGWYSQNVVWTAGRHRVTPDIAYGEPRLLAGLEIRCADGTEHVILTDPTWRCAPGPITQSNIYAGEHYDARLERPGWDAPEFDDSAWEAVEIVAPPGGRLEPQDMPAIKVIETLTPVSIRQAADACCMVDMGQNFAGWARIRLHAPAGTRVQLRFAETLGADGMLDTASTGVFATGVEQEDVYTGRGGGPEVWEPRFTYHGFRYVEVRGWPGVPAAGDITGVVVHTALPEAGRFQCSDERLNQLHRMALWTHRSNLHGVPTDCPVRERCGWLGDAHIVCEYSIYNFQGQAFWRKYLDDLETSRATAGGLPCNIAPGRRRCGRAKPDWMAAMILIPWHLYVYYGDREALQRHWDGMQAVIEHFRERSTDWTLSGGYGDWCDPLHGPTPTYTPEEVTTTLWFHECARICARTAELLGDADAAARYAAWPARIRDAFRGRFYDASRQSFGSQTADAMALHFGLVPDGQEKEVVNSLVRDITETHHRHHSVGIMGLRYLFEVLTRHGRGDIALGLMHQDTFPSFGGLIQRGATTLWEYWGEGSHTYNERPRSLNHPMMGGFDNWFYNTLAGIRPDPEHPGFRRFFLEPHPMPGLDHVHAHYDCPYGRILSEWRTHGDRFVWSVEVPGGTAAHIVLPRSGATRRLDGPARTTLTDSSVDRT